jgi:hypothetical protein
MQENYWTRSSVPASSASSIMVEHRLAPSHNSIYSSDHLFPLVIRDYDDAGKLSKLLPPPIMPCSESSFECYKLYVKARSNFSGDEIGGERLRALLWPGANLMKFSRRHVMNDLLPYVCFVVSLVYGSIGGGEN